MERKIKESLSISWKEGIPASMMLGVLDYYLIPFGLYLGATNRAVAVLSSLPHLAASMAQPWAVEAVRRAGSRLRFVVATAAAAMRFLSAGMLSRMTELPMRATPESEFTFLMFLRRFRESNFVKFVLFVASTLFTTHLAAPYFSVYMLRDLGLSYFTYMLIHLAAVVGSLAAFPIWGRNADVVGNARILKTTGWLVPVIPLLWLVSRDPAYLVLVEFFAGFVWGGFNLCAANFIYDAVTPEKRVRCLGYFNLISGLAIFAGAMIGGFLADRLPPLFGLPLMTLFLISGLMRFVAMLWPWGRFKEVRQGARHVSSGRLFFSVVGIRPLTGEALE